MTEDHRTPGAVGRADSESVELVVNVYERTWRPVVAPGWWDDIASSLEHDFARRTIVIANVDDAPAVLRKAKSLVARGEIDDVIVVDEVIDDALASVGLARADLGRIAYFSEWAFAMLAERRTISTRRNEPLPKWICHFDPELEMVEPGPWIARSIRRMGGDARIAVAMPSWGAAAASELTPVGDGLGVGYGFTDQIYLARRAFLSGRIYSERCPASLRFPLTDIAWIFEARIDAYLRRHRLLRLVDLEARYRHPPETGGSYPSRTFVERLRRLRRKWMRRTVTRYGEDPERAIVVPPPARPPTR